jgi:Immunity protein 40
VIAFSNRHQRFDRAFAMQMPADYLTRLESKGVRIDLPGLDEIALKRADALQAVELLRTATVHILGGDVWYRRRGRFEIAYANWYADRRTDEGSSAYLQRSLDKTLQYVREFPEPADAEPLFVLVIPVRRPRSPDQL